MISSGIFPPKLSNQQSTFLRPYKVDRCSKCHDLSWSCIYCCCRPLSIEFQWIIECGNAGSQIYLLKSYIRVSIKFKRWFCIVFRSSPSFFCGSLQHFDSNLFFFFFNFLPHHIRVFICLVDSVDWWVENELMDSDQYNNNWISRF